MTHPSPARLATTLALLAAAHVLPARAQEPGPMRLEGSGAPAAVERPAERTERVVSLGPSDAARAATSTELRFPFASRADEEIGSARVRVEVVSVPEAPIDVVVNDEQIGTIPAGRSAIGVHDLRIDPLTIGVRNQLILRVRVGPGPACRIPPHPWSGIASAELRTVTRPVALPDQLALLPLPFADPGFDAGASVPVVVTITDAERVRLAALVASWFAVDAPIPITFTTEIGALPETRAIVLVDGADDAAVLGVPVPRGPSIRMVDHPRFRGSNVKLLVVGGRSREELRTAVETLARRAPRLAGSEVSLSPSPGVDPKPAQPYAAPRWFAPGKPVRLTEPPASGAYGHDGATPGILSTRFRVAPDLWIWPTRTVRLDLAWEQRIPAGTPPPRLDVELNGYFLTTLRPLEGGGTRTGHARLAIPREHMRGFNELRVYVRYPERDPCAAGPLASGGAPTDPPHVALTGESVLHVEPFSLFAMQPDVARFAYDGYPFTRVADLGETVFALPERPSPPEIATVLTAMGRFAQITGRIGWRARVVSATSAPDEALLSRDLLVVGGPDDNPLVARWASLLPVAFERGGARVRRRDALGAADALLGGLAPILEARRAASLLSAGPRPAAIIGIQSPLSPGRIAMMVTAGASADLPPFDRFLGYAESRTGSADVLLVAGERRAMLRLGGAFGRGELDGWTRLRWFLASHWLTLLPLVAAGTLLMAGQLRDFLDRRMRERLRWADAP